MTRIATSVRSPWLALAALAVTTILVALVAFVTRAEPPPAPRLPEPDHGCVIPERAMPQACEDYGRVLEVLASCESLPVDARDALRQSWAAVVQSVGELTPEGKAALGEACAQGRDALVDAARTLCPNVELAQ